MRIALLVALTIVSLPAQPPAPKQPIAFSHKVHSAVPILCLDCHAIKPPGDLAGYPSVSTCMACHTSIKKDSPEIQKLARYAAEHSEIPWVRVYQLPRTIYFSHEIHHRKAKVDCTVCHGSVAERDVIAKEKETTMVACMACHDEHKASNDCALCHDSF